MQNNESNESAVGRCKSGCGYFGNPTFEGLCSVCYKEKCDRQMSNNEEVTSKELPSSFTDSNEKAIDKSHSKNEELLPLINDDEPKKYDLNTSNENEDYLADLRSSNSPDDKSSLLELSSTQECYTTSAINLSSACTSPVVCSSSLPLTPSTSSIKDVESSSTKKSNRCHICKKKVGLTGFSCRCNGLFCSTHRYSDTHNCPFNYKQHGQHEIRKNNPIISAEKVTKI